MTYLAQSTPSAPSPAPTRVLLPLLYLAGIASAEVATRGGSPGIGLTLYAITLIGGLNHAAASARRERALPLAVAVLALGRLLSLTVPLVSDGGVYWYLVVTLSTLAGVVLVARRARCSRRDLGLVADYRVVVASLALIPFELLLGYSYHAVIRAPALLGEGVVTDILALALVALLPGIVEEVLFRGLLQQAASRRIGRVPGILYVAVLYTVLAAVPWSVIGVAVVFATALGLAVLRSSTGSVVPAVVAHVCLNVGLIVAATLT